MRGATNLVNATTPCGTERKVVSGRGGSSDLPALAVAFQFVHSYRFDLYQWGAYKGDAPEKFTPI